MSEYLALAIAFVVLYLIECLHFVHPRTILLSSACLGRCSVALSGSRFLLGGKSVVFSTVLAPWGQNYFLESSTKPELKLPVANSSQISEQWRTLMHDTRVLRVVCTLLFFLFLLLLLQAVFLFLSVEILFAILVLIVASLAAIAVLSFLFLKRHVSKKRAARWGLAVKCLFYPPASLRVIDQIAEYFFQAEQPLEVALIVGNTDELTPILARMIRELRYPLNDERTVSDSERESQLTALESLISENEISTEEYLRPRLTETGDGTHYCPRCLQVYEKESGQCIDCPGVELVTLSQ